MNILEEIIENHPGATFLKPDGLDDAVIGIFYNPDRLVYCKEKAVLAYMAQEECSGEDALEWLEFNTFSAYIGPQTPVWLDLDDIDE